jgi:hypothetical protein
LAQIDAGGVDKLVSAMYQQSTADRLIVANPENANALYRGYLGIGRLGLSGLPRGWFSGTKRLVWVHA